MNPNTYSAEYRANAVKIVTEQGLTVAAAAEQLAVNYHSDVARRTRAWTW